MSLGGELNTTAYSGRFYRVSWSATQSIADNTSTISWTLEAIGGGSNWYAERTLNVVIAGTTVYSKTNRVERYAGVIDSGTITLNHDNEGNRSFAMSVQAAVYGSSVNCSASGTFTLNPIPRQAIILSASNFDDEHNPVITYSNPAGDNVEVLEACISLTGMDADIEYRPINKTGSGFTFELTDAEREVLLRATTDSNSRTVVFYVRTTIGGVKYYSSLTKTFSVVNAEPIINPTVFDTNELTKTLTGDNTRFIKYYSNLEYALNFECLKYATYKSCQITCGSETQTSLTGTFNNIEANEITFTFTDSRNNTITKTINFDMVDYVKPTCNLLTSFELETETTAKIKLNVTGKCFYGSFGAINNEPTIMYKYKVDNGEYGDWTYYSGDIPTFENNEYSIEIEITDLNYLNTYTIQAQIVDWLNMVGSNEELVKIIPVFDWGENDFNFNVPVTIQGNTINDFVIETGTDSMGTNGTWYWRKWASGRAECYGCRNYGNMGISSAWGALYESATFSQSLPYGLFNSIPEYIDIEIRNSNYAGWVVQGFSAATATQTGDFCVVRPVSGTLSQVHLSFNVIGRWK